MTLLNKTVGRVSAAGAWVTAFCAATIAVLVCLDVGLRAMGSRGIEGVVEATTVLLVFVAHLGLASAQREGYHVATTVVTSRMPSRVRRPVTSAVLLACAAFVAVLTYATFERALLATERLESSYGAVNVQLWPARWAITIGLAWLTVEIVLSAVRTLSSDDPPEHAESLGLQSEES